MGRVLGGDLTTRSGPIREISAQDLSPWVVMMVVTPRSTSFSVALVVHHRFDSLVNYTAWSIKTRCNLLHQTLSHCPPYLETL
ncbi:hypothetical protein PpBr36_00128, partial [Pyricularia pennisetigena]|uniref:hypothetical protein n=1 Tax=Pyricularia pennisetigena TaxID=1578925 RepID=UPI00114FECA8